MKKKIDVVRIIVWSLVLTTILIVLNAKRIVEWRNEVGRQKAIENLRAQRDVPRIMPRAHVEKPVAESGVTVRGDQLSTPGSYPVTPNMKLADILRKGGIDKVFFGPPRPSPLVKIHITRWLSERDRKEVFNETFSTLNTSTCNTFLLRDGDVVDVKIIR